MKITNALNNIDESLIAEAERFKPRKKVYVKWAAAACLVLAVAAVIAFLPKGTRLKLEKSTVTVTEGVHGTVPSGSKDLIVYISEEEMFSDERIEIVKGKVTKLTNITIDFKGEKEYRCIATVAVEKVYKGAAVVGDSIEILLPCVIAEDAPKVEDCGIAAGLFVGAEGIFMPRTVDEKSRWEQYGETLYLKELCDYSFSDGMRWMFYMKDNRLVYLPAAYPSASTAVDLDDIEEYVLNQLDKN